jgi:hypothetical protein
MLAVSSFAAMTAGATAGGHFASEVAHTTIVGTEASGHRLHLKGDFGEGQIGCNQASYSGTTTNTTETAVSITPTYAECSTTGSSAVTVTPNGCTYTFTVAAGTTSSTEQTAHVVCPAGKTIEIHHPNCTITVAGGQTVANAATYTPVTENGKHAITMDVSAKFNSQYHGGICIFLGTAHTGELNGSVTVRGTDTAGNPVGITAT